MSVAIPGFFSRTDATGGVHTAYRVIVSADSDQKWTVSRRFSEFVTLAANLKDKYPHIASKLPSKMSLSLESRRAGLEAFLLAVCQVCVGDPIVDAFLRQDLVLLSSTPSQHLALMPPSLAGSISAEALNLLSHQALHLSSSFPPHPDAALSIAERDTLRHVIAVSLGGDHDRFISGLTLPSDGSFATRPAISISYLTLIMTADHDRSTIDWSVWSAIYQIAISQILQSTPVDPLSVRSQIASLIPDHPLLPDILQHLPISAQPSEQEDRFSQVKDTLRMHLTLVTQSPTPKSLRAAREWIDSELFPLLPDGSVFAPLPHCVTTLIWETMLSMIQASAAEPWDGGVDPNRWHLVARHLLPALGLSHLQTDTCFLKLLLRESEKRPEVILRATSPQKRLFFRGISAFFSDLLSDPFPYALDLLNNLRASLSSKLALEAVKGDQKLTAAIEQLLVDATACDIGCLLAKFERVGELWRIGSSILTTEEICSNIKNCLLGEETADSSEAVDPGVCMIGMLMNFDFVSTAAPTDGRVWGKGSTPKAPVVERSGVLSFWEAVTSRLPLLFPAAAQQPLSLLLSPPSLFLPADLDAAFLHHLLYHIKVGIQTDLKMAVNRLALALPPCEAWKYRGLDAFVSTLDDNAPFAFGVFTGLRDVSRRICRVVCGLAKDEILPSSLANAVRVMDLTHRGRAPHGLLHCKAIEDAITREVWKSTADISRPLTYASCRVQFSRLRKLAPGWLKLVAQGWSGIIHAPGAVAAHALSIVVTHDLRTMELSRFSSAQATLLDDLTRLDRVVQECVMTVDARGDGVASSARSFFDFDLLFSRPVEEHILTASQMLLDAARHLSESHELWDNEQVDAPLFDVMDDVADLLRRAKIPSLPRLTVTMFRRFNHTLSEWMRIMRDQLPSIWGPSQPGLLAHERGLRSLLTSANLGLVPMEQVAQILAPFGVPRLLARLIALENVSPRLIALEESALSCWGDDVVELVWVKNRLIQFGEATMVDVQSTIDSVSRFVVQRIVYHDLRPCLFDNLYLADGSMQVFISALAQMLKKLDGATERYSLVTGLARQVAIAWVRIVLYGSPARSFNGGASAFKSDLKELHGCFLAHGGLNEDDISQALVPCHHIASLFRHSPPALYDIMTNQGSEAILRVEAWAVLQHLTGVDSQLLIKASAMMKEVDW